MKKIWIVAILGFLMIPTSAWGQQATIEQAIVRYAAPEAVSVSTYAYTNVVSTTTRALVPRLTAIILDSPSTNSANMYGHIGECSSTSVSTSTVLGPIEIAPSAQTGYILLSPDLCLWLISKHTSAEYINVQGVSQRR